jgi:hypothetical protein
VTLHFLLSSFLIRASLAMFKNCLSTFSGISANEQILLIGPPFKRLDALVLSPSSHSSL